MTIMKYDEILNINIYRSFGIGIKKDEATESGKGVDIFLYSFAALMLTALHRRKTVKMV